MAKIKIKKVVEFDSAAAKKIQELRQKVAAWQEVLDECLAAYIKDGLARGLSYRQIAEPIGYDHTTIWATAYNLGLEKTKVQ